MNRVFFIVLLVGFLLSCREGNLNYKIVYKNDKEGNTIVGSKEQLIQSIRGGSSIKVGWGVKGKTHSIEHLSEPIWIAVLDEKEVIAHLDAQILSKTEWDDLTANYSDSTLLHQEWRVVLTTKGEFDAVWYDRKEGKISKRRPQNHTITWFAKDGLNNSPPLYMNAN